VQKLSGKPGIREFFIRSVGSRPGGKAQRRKEKKSGWGVENNNQPTQMQEKRDGVSKKTLKLKKRGASSCGTRENSYGSTISKKRKDRMLKVEEDVFVMSQREKGRRRKGGKT